MKFCHIKRILNRFLNTKEVKQARLKYGAFEKEKREIVDSLSMLYGKTVKDLTNREMQKIPYLCYLFKHVYMVPYYEATDISLSTMEIYSDYIPVEQEGEKSLYTYGEFADFDDTVKIYLGFLNKEETMNKEVVGVILEIFNTIAHEYRHNFQFRVADFSEENNAKANKLLDKYAKLIKQEAKSWSVDASQIDVLQHLLTANDSYGQYYYPQETQDYKTYLGSLAYSAYFNDYIEMDARDAELECMREIIKDIERYSSPIVDLEWYVKDKYKQKAENEKKSRKRYSSYFKNYEKIMNSISEKDYVKYARLLKNKSIEEYYLGIKDVKKRVDRGDDSYYQLDKKFTKRYDADILKRAFKFILQDLTGSKSRVLNADENPNEYLERVNRLGLLFLKYGLNNASDLLEQEVKNSKVKQTSLLVSYDNMIERYFDLLKSGKVTLDSFTRFKDMSIDKQLEVFTDYIRQGKIEFCRQILYDIDNFTDIERRIGQAFERGGNLEKLLLNSVLEKPRTVCNCILQQTVLPLEYNRREFSVLDTIYDRLNYLARLQSEGTLEYDDIDEMIALIADMCLVLNVPYYTHRSNLEIRDTIEEQKIQDDLYNLYEYAENIGYDKVCSILGRRPRIDEYRYANVDDRKHFVLKGAAYYERFKRIYGKIAYDDIIRTKLNVEQLQAELDFEM